MPDWTLDYKDEPGTGELTYLDPSTLEFAKRGDVLILTIQNDRSYLKVHPARAFPLTEIHDYISLLDAISGREIGLLRSLRDLDGPTRQLVETELDRRYFIPKITRVIRAKKEFGTVYWDVDTDRGRRKFVMRGIRDSMHQIEPGRYLINDVDGNRFEVEQLADLDSRSQTQWDALI